MTVRREARVLLAVVWLLLCAVDSQALMLLLPAIGIHDPWPQFWIALPVQLIAAWLYIRLVVRPLRRRLEKCDA